MFANRHRPSKARRTYKIIQVKNKKEYSPANPKACSQGNAADAHVGAQLCVGVIGMYHSGIGGGGFALIRDADGNYEAIDYREAAPSAAFEDMYKGNLNGAVVGGLAVAVPGDLKGLEYLHTKYGVSKPPVLLIS